MDESEQLFIHPWWNLQSTRSISNPRVQRADVCDKCVKPTSTRNETFQVLSRVSGAFLAFSELYSATCLYAVSPTAPRQAWAGAHAHL